MRIGTIALILAVSYAPGFAGDKRGANWPQFRGPGGLGIAAGNKPLPAEFDQSRNALWRCAISKGHSSPCVWGDRIFLTGRVDDKLETICIDKTTRAAASSRAWTRSAGKRDYIQRLGSGGPYYASPVAGDGKIYASSARGVVTVFEAGDSLKILAKNDLKERIMATPAIVDGKLYVRTEEALYAFGLVE